MKILSQSGLNSINSAQQSAAVSAEPRATCEHGSADTAQAIIPLAYNWEKEAGLDVVGRPYPINNMGVTEVLRPESVTTNGVELFECDGTEIIALRQKGKSGKLEFIRVPAANKSANRRAAFIDQCSFTIRVPEFNQRSLVPPYAVTGENWPDHDAVYRLSSVLIDIFGFGIENQRSRGVNFYQESYNLANGYGILSIGGQNNTVSVQMYGQGCLMAQRGWERRLYAFFVALGPKNIWFSRVDCASDFFDGQYTPEQAYEESREGKFALNNRRPHVEKRGDWDDPKSGKTLYVGRRESGKVTRIYQKGLEQLGKATSRDVMADENHPLHRLTNWVRIETEWHNKNRVIPPEILLNPGEYLAGAHPAFSFIQEIQSRIETKTAHAVMTVEKAVAMVRRQMGPTIYALLQLKGPGVLLQMLRQQLPNWARGMGELPPISEADWWTWERELSTIPF